MVTVRLVPGATADPRQVAQLMACTASRQRAARKGPGGALLCRANIAPAWTRASATTAATSAPPAAPSAPPAGPSSGGAGEEAGSDGEEEEEDDEEEEEEEEEDQGGLPRSAAAADGLHPALRKDAGQSEEEEEDEEEEEGGGSSGSEEEGGGGVMSAQEEQVLCDVCDAVQVVMDLAAHLLITHGAP